MRRLLLGQIAALVIMIAVTGLTIYSFANRELAEPSVSLPNVTASPEETDTAMTKPQSFADADALIANYLADAVTCRPVDSGLISFAAQFNPQINEDLFVLLKERAYDDSMWYETTGYTLRALYDMYTENPDVRLKDGDRSATLAFTGDICLADDWYIMSYYLRYGGGDITSAFDGKLLSRMRDADILVVNNEFTFSERGTPLIGKAYKFRSLPSNVSMLAEIGVDIAGLANNHCYDYGADAFADTLTTLNDAGIAYVGAGADIDEAMKPVYLIAGGVKIAIVAATRAEKNIFTPEATVENGGVLRTYENERFVSVIKEADANADYVIAYLHWGTENSTVLEEAQTAGAREFIDAGADIIVGAHPHCLQGVDYYNGKPIVYSLGNFWFNLETVDTALLEIEIDSAGTPSLRLVPCVQTFGKTSDVTGSPAAERILGHLRELSPNVLIDETGAMSEVTSE